MGMIKEFKEFALNGSMVDMAVGIVMGGAVGKLVGSIVDDLISPIVGLFMGGTDLAAAGAKIGESVTTDEAGNQITQDLMLKYGSFINNFIQFLVLAFVIFMLVKMINNAKKAMSMEAPAAGPSEVDLLTEIRDSLKKG